MKTLFGVVRIFQTQRDRNTPEYRQWRRAVFTRDDYTCQTCGQTSGKLNAHHKQSYAKNPQLRTELSNGITLCEKCHKAIHRMGGKPFYEVNESCGVIETRATTQEGVAFNNRLLNEIHNFTGNELIVYGILGSTPRGLTISQALEKLTRRKGKTPCMIDDTFRKCIKTLQALGFVEVSERGKKSGHENIYRAKQQGTYGLGYTIVSTLAINGVIDGRITPAELKVYIQLLRYASSACESWPSQHAMARDLRIAKTGINKMLRRLENADYLYIEHYYTNSGLRHCKYRLRA